MYSKVDALVSLVISTYSASIDKSTRIDYLRDLQEIVVDPRLIVYPGVDTPVSLSPSKSESVYPISLRSSTLVYLSPKS